MKARLIEPDHPAWRDFLDHTDHDFYHLPGYTDLSARHEGGRPRALFVEDGQRTMLLPLIARDIPGGDSDVTSAYGHPGPLTSPDGSGSFLEDALASGSEHLASEGHVSMFIRLHPLLNATPPSGPGLVIRHGDTVSIDLSKPEDVLWSETRRNHRQQIRQAIEAGYQVRLDEDWSHLPDFVALYRSTMARLGASDYYHFADDYFDGLRGALEPNVHLAVVEHADRAVAAMLVVETAGIVVTHLSGSDEAHARHQPTKLIYDFVRRWAKGRGDRWVQIGGGYGAGDDSLMHFKAGFSPLRFPYFTLRHILRPEAYERLVQGRGPLGLPTPDLQDDGYFPAYRAPRAGPPAP